MKPQDSRFQEAASDFVAAPMWIVMLAVFLAGVAVGIACVA